MNSLDSVFCKKCGEALPEEELQISRQKLDDLLKEGYTIFNEGRIEEAMMVAESVLMSNPTSSSAHSLKGMCHERKGEFGEALEAYEGVVELNPDSALDKIKVNQLRNKLAVPVQIEAKAPNRSLAIAGAAATIVFVVAMGGIFGSINARADEPVVKKGGTIDPGASQPLQDIPAAKNQTPQVQTDPGAGIDPSAQVQQPNTSNVQPPSNNGGVLPKANSNGQTEVIRPFSPDISGIIGNTSVRPIGGNGNTLPATGNSGAAGGTNANNGAGTRVQNTGGLDPQRTIDPPVEDDQRDPEQEERKDTGIYDIKIASGGTEGGLGGSQPVNDANRAQALLKAADTKFMLQRYSEASAAYDAALRAGANAAKCYQRLGDCYKYLGQRDQAIGAYSRAAAGYEKSGNSRAALTCRQAVKDLQGG